ncbi:MAG: hypothetical protein WBY94_06165 [Polyangiaceae bacterium]
MLVPAMTFAWWLVSMSASAPPSRSHGMPIEKAASTEAATEARDDAQDSDGEDEAAPAEQAEETEGESSDDTTSTRVHLKVVTPEIVRLAKSFLDLPMGSERSMSVDGRRYVFVLERHYHPPGFVGGPHGWHKGVTVYGVRP